MHAFDVLGDPVRRRLLELLADGERSVGELVAVVQDEFGISQPAVSWQLRVLRESGFVTVRPIGSRRMYAIGAEPWREIECWLARYGRFWQHSLDAIATEVARGRRAHRGPPGERPAAEAAEDTDAEGGDCARDMREDG